MKPHYSITTRLLTPGLLALALTASVFGQGSLTPPAGAPVPTMKTLQQIEPRVDVNSLAGDATNARVISQPGSYYLSGPLDVLLGKTNGIAITAPDVTLDLNGFTIHRTSAPVGAGILVSAARAIIRDGRIDSFLNGVSTTATGDTIRLERMTASNCSGYGFSLAVNASLTDCTATKNTGGGFSAGDSGVFDRCVASGNLSAAGFQVGTASMLTACVVREHIGTLGMEVGPFSHLDKCVLTGLTLSNFVIHAGDSCLIESCLASASTVAGGLVAEAHCKVLNCHLDTLNISGTGSAILVATGSRVSGCVCDDNNAPFALNTSIGITGGLYCTIEDCTVNRNPGAGIKTGYACQVNRCHVTLGSVDGIVIGGARNVVRDNVCSNNTNYGISLPATVTGCRVEANEVDASAQGLSVAGTGNLIFHNTATGNTTNYVIAANNKVGVIVVAPNSSAISGGSGGAGVGTTDPWANFSF